jgi:hypothetical protein
VSGAVGPERWCECLGYPGYEVSDRGRVRSWRVSGFADLKAAFPKILRSTYLQGYRYVSLSLGADAAVSKSVHRLVLEAFVGPCPPDKSEAGHNDGVRNNNALSNLAWKDLKEQADDRRKHKCLGHWRSRLLKIEDESSLTNAPSQARPSKPPKGSAASRCQLAPKATMDPAVVHQIRTHRGWMASNVLADVFGVSPVTICRIQNTRKRAPWATLEVA